jgi:hypothetical protein
MTPISFSLSHSQEKQGFSPSHHTYFEWDLKSLLVEVVWKNAAKLWTGMATWRRAICGHDVHTSKSTTRRRLSLERLVVRDFYESYFYSVLCCLVACQTWARKPESELHSIFLVVALQESGNLPQAAGPRQRLCHSKHTAKLIGKFYPLKRLICWVHIFRHTTNGLPWVFYVSRRTPTANGVVSSRWVPHCIFVVCMRSLRQVRCLICRVHLLRPANPTMGPIGVICRELSPECRKSEQ